MCDLYPDYFILPVAVHNGDLMTFTEYDDNMGFSAFPTMSIMRKRSSASVR
ncbi:MAG: hypothetical protein IPJ40_20260 [Saprospirales bacterium]|nr:hypothetical protein [Saprospirales bacterium]